MNRGVQRACVALLFLLCGAFLFAGGQDPVKRYFDIFAEPAHPSFSAKGSFEYKEIYYKDGVANRLSLSYTMTYYHDGRGKRSRVKLTGDPTGGADIVVKNNRVTANIPYSETQYRDEPLTSITIQGGLIERPQDILDFLSFKLINTDERIVRTNFSQKDGLGYLTVVYAGHRDTITFEMKTMKVREIVRMQGGKQIYIIPKNYTKFGDRYFPKQATIYDEKKTKRMQIFFGNVSEVKNWSDAQFTVSF